MLLCGIDAMNAKLDKLEALEAAARELKRSIYDLKNEIKLNLSGPEPAETDLYYINWQLVDRQRFDTTTFKKLHTALYEQFLKPETADRFQYKRR